MRKTSNLKGYTQPHNVFSLKHNIIQVPLTSWSTLSLGLRTTRRFESPGVFNKRKTSNNQLITFCRVSAELTQTCVNMDGYAFLKPQGCDCLNVIDGSVWELRARPGQHAGARVDGPGHGLHVDGTRLGVDCDVFNHHVKHGSGLKINIVKTKQDWSACIMKKVSQGCITQFERFDKNNCLDPFGKKYRHHIVMSVFPQF